MFPVIQRWYNYTTDLSIMSSYAAKYAAKNAGKQVSGMLEPLIGDDDSMDDSEDSDASSKLETVKRSPLEQLKSAAVFLGLGAGLVASAGAMVLAPTVFVFVMAGVCIGNVPYAAFKESRIGKLPSLRSMNNKLREDANKLEDEVDILSDEIDALEPEADRAAAVEEELREIANQQQVNVDKLVELVKENEIILEKMRDNLRHRIVQDIITIVVKSDTDNDQTIDRQEAKTLALRIRLALQEYDVQFDSEKFLNAIGKNPSVTGVIAIVQKLLPKPKGDGGESSDSEGEESESDDDDMFDMFHMGAGDKRRGSVIYTGSTEGEDELGRMSLMKCDKRKSSKRINAKSPTSRQRRSPRSLSRRSTMSSSDGSEW